MGRVVIFGLMPNDHAPAHRDSEPGRDLTVAQSLSIDPRGTKEFYLSDPDGEEVDVDSKLYWFNDMDYHGVRSQPVFRYSIRVDGVYRPAFLRDLQRRQR
jgi:Rieske 2Fe-2S family protein